MTLEKVLEEEIRLAKQQTEFGYENKSAEDVAEGNADLKALNRFLLKCHQNGLLTEIKPV